MRGISSTNEIIHRRTLRIPKGMNNAVSISIASCVDILLRNEKRTDGEYKTKDRLE